jgi:hypothetical protein
MSTRPFRLLGATLLALCALTACKDKQPPAPPQPAATQPQAPAQPTRTREQAMAALMALPELKAWSDQIEAKSHGKVHGAVIEDDPTPRVLNGKRYYQLSFVEDRKQDVHRRASFLVAQQGDDILVEDGETDSVQSLTEWRRNIQNVELKSH